MTEVRYERLHPAELRAELERAPLAYVPVGTLEFHGEHLPFGVDSFEAHALCVRAAERSGGVVLPPVYLASGCLDLPGTLSFEPTLVEAWVRATVDRLAGRGFRADRRADRARAARPQPPAEARLRRGRGARTRGSPRTRSAGSS